MIAQIGCELPQGRQAAFEDVRGQRHGLELRKELKRGERALEKGRACGAGGAWQATGRGTPHEGLEEHRHTDGPSRAHLKSLVVRVHLLDLRKHCTRSRGGLVVLGGRERAGTVEADEEIDEIDSPDCVPW